MTKWLKESARPVAAAKLLYKSLILRGHSRFIIDVPIKLQIRNGLIVNLIPLLSISPLFPAYCSHNLAKWLGWSNINKRHELNEVICVYKIQSKLSYPNNIVFSNRRWAHNRSAPNGCDIDTELRRTRTGAKAFSISGTKFNHNLPADVRRIPSMHHLPLRKMYHSTTPPVGNY